MLDESDYSPPRIAEVRRLQEQLSRWLVRTPTMRCRSLEDRLGGKIEIHGKLEFLQRTGTFKPRGALANILGLDTAQRRAGVTAVSAGNHAIATAFAARALNTTAKVVMMRSASPVRMDACRALGAELVLVDDVHSAFAAAESIQNEEGRFFVHPFEGKPVATGTATVGLEICEQVGDFDAVIVPIGGGGLCAGIASAIKQIKPDVTVIGVEPEGADTMRRSFESGAPQSIDKVTTFADSLGAPFAMPYSFALCRQFVDELVLVSDAEIREAMAILFSSMKMAVEPACAASTAALAGPLDGRFNGEKVVLVYCGSNIDWKTYAANRNGTEC